jgi:hypothetical protein
MVPLLSATEHGFSAKLSPRSGWKKLCLHPVINVLYSRSNLGDDMAECNYEKQGMFSASFFWGEHSKKKLASHQRV